MPKELVVNAWCDPCFREGERVEAEEVTVALGHLGNMKPQVMLLCERHRKEHYDPLLTLLEEFGQASDKAKKAGSIPKAEGGDPGNSPCPQCGHVAPNRSALGHHARSAHQMTITELLDEPVRFICKHCPSGPGTGYGSGTGFSAHRRAAHGLTPDDPLKPGENLVDDRMYLKESKSVR